MMKKTFAIAALLASLTVAAAPTPDDKPPPKAEVTCGNLLGSGVVRVIVGGVVYVVYIKCGLSI